MRLVSFVHTAAPTEVCWGLWEPEKGYVLDARISDASLPETLRHAVDMGTDIFPKLHAIEELDNREKLHNARIALQDIQLQAPYTTPPRNILCTGINYKEHFKELDRPLVAEQTLPEHPFIFTKPCTAIAHPDSAVMSHATHTQSYDYEVELAVIIGKRGTNIPKEQALEYVFGYSIINDMSARDLQRITTQWYRGKALDQSAPFGPCITCKDSIPDPQNLRIMSRINNEVRQDSHTSYMLFDVATLIHIMSQGATFLPGDIIATGTPAGVGMSFKPPKFLKSGDSMDLEIEHIGILHNTIA